MAAFIHRAARSVLFLAAMAMASCATPRADVEGEISIAPRGPGAVFQSVEAAAIDALAYAHGVSRRDADTPLMAGGTIRAVEGGFTYDGIEVASPNAPTTLQLRLTRSDVARFHLYPRVERFRVDRMNERPSRTDRRSVDVVDPAHRPLFVLTPRLSVIAYRGAELPSVEIADLRPRTLQGGLAGE